MSDLTTITLLLVAPTAVLTLCAIVRRWHALLDLSHFDPDAGFGEEG